MSRSKKDVELMKGMCQRFVAIMSELQLTPAEISRALGYCNSATIAKLQRGEAFVDVERLYHLAQIRSPNGGQVDLNWLITGEPLKGIKK